MDLKMLAWRLIIFIGIGIISLVTYYFEITSWELTAIVGVFVFTTTIQLYLAYKKEDVDAS